MIDFIKVYSQDKSHTHILKEKFELITDVNEKTGETTGKSMGTIQNEYKLTLHQSGRISIMGSLHKAFNKGTNDSDFTYSQLIQSINDFSELFELKPSQCFLENFEYGANIPLPYSPKIILSNIVSTRTGDTFSKMKGIGLECRKSQFRYKIYNKSAQYDRDDYLLRFEIHEYKMCRNSAVKTLQDLMNYELWESLSDSLIHYGNQIIFTDKFQINDIKNSPDRNLIPSLRDLDNIRYWRELEPYQRNRQIKKLERIQNYGKYKVSATFKTGLKLKLDQLLTSARISQFNY